MEVGSSPVDRRQRRRRESIEEVLDHALAIMAQEGVAGLSLGEIARRMQIRPPSLYSYFPSKNALYDALFLRGWRLLLDAVREHERLHPPVEDDLGLVLLRSGRHFVGWSVRHSAYAQLLFWRPVPGFQPSDEAYQPAVELSEYSVGRMRELQDRGLIRADADIAEVHREWTVLVSGVISQHLSNAPGEPFDTGPYAAALAGLTGSFAAHYTPAPQSRTTTPPPRRGHARTPRSDR